MNTLDSIFPNGPFGIGEVRKIKVEQEYDSAEDALKVYDTITALKGMKAHEIREVLAELPPETLQTLYAELTDIMA